MAIRPRDRPTRGPPATVASCAWRRVESLEAALWCFAHTESFDAAILEAANLGDDADTTAAVCGQVTERVGGRRRGEHVDRGFTA